MRMLICLFSIVLLIFSCSDEDKEGSKWKVSGEDEYNEIIDESLLYKSLSEFEKILLAPAFHYEKSGITGFNNQITINAEAVPDDSSETNQIDLSEQSSMKSDGEGNFHLSYSNSHHEGWDMIWKEDFLYQKMLGGEYSRYVSMGKHTFTKENLFKVIPEFYTVLRDNASIKSVVQATVKGKSVKKVTITFGNKKVEIPPLKDQKYLQNSFGVQAMENDKLINAFMNKKKKSVSGTLNVFVTDNMIPLKMDISVAFVLYEGDVSFKITGTRELITKKYDIKMPKFRPEYHRRKIDEAVNIMEDSNKK